ncbi:MAG: hypothetical protein V4727_01675 [Verrucomicrobiota bacterium]
MKNASGFPEAFFVPFTVLEDISGILYREGGGFGGEEEKKYQLNPELLISPSSSLLVE